METTNKIQHIYTEVCKKGGIKMVTFRLQATTQKSYYGKAVVTEIGDNYYLLSYDTIVCKYTKEREFKRMWNDYSKTTMNHINDFRKLFGLERITKKEWEKMKVY